MATTTTAFNADTFKANARNYRANRRMVDVLVSLGYGTEGFNPHDIVVNAVEVMQTLEAMSANGSAYTPDSGQGFGSENAASIADAILGRKKSAASIKSAFSKVGS